jgi:hypothetical protein
MIVLRATNAMPAFTRYAGPVMSVFIVGFACWGIATGINLLQLREWARISMVVFSGLLLAMCVPGLLMMLLLPFPTPAAPDAPTGLTAPQMEHMMTAARIGMAFFYGLLSVLGAWWIYFFHSRAVKEQFRGAMTPASTWLPANADSVPGAPKRPVSITIIAYLALLGGCMIPFLRIMNLPMAFLGFYFTGGKASLIVIGFMTVQLLMAYGLLRMKMWGRSVAIYYFNFAIFNSIISVILPGAQARYVEAMSGMQGAMEGSMGLPATQQYRFPLWISLVFSLPVIAVQLWFVVKRKKAFEDAHRATGLR